MEAADAEEYTQALAQVGGGWWRQIALGQRLGVPERLGYDSTREWVEQRLGHYAKLPVEDRRQAVKELSAEGHTPNQIADVLGTTARTVQRDKKAPTNVAAKPAKKAAKSAPGATNVAAKPEATEADWRAIVGHVDAVRDLDRAPSPSFAERVESSALTWKQAAREAKRWERERSESMERDRKRIRAANSAWDLVRRIAADPDHPYLKEMVGGLGDTDREALETELETRRHD